MTYYYVINAILFIDRRVAVRQTFHAGLTLSPFVDKGQRADIENVKGTRQQTPISCPHCVCIK